MGLIGTWRGEGSGEYPTIQDFTYTEELTFTSVGKPFLAYQQRTWGPDGSPMHVETGYLRIPAPEKAEFVLALPTGQSELLEGGLVTSGEAIELELEGRVLNTATAKQVDATQRSYRLRGDELVTSFGMAAVGQSMAHHLHSVLQRQH